MPVTFVYVLGARGIGKTYGALKYMIEEDKQFILMRRTQTQADLISNESFTPIKSVFNDMDLAYKVNKISKQTGAIYYDPEECYTDSKFGYSMPFCYTCALSTFSNMRGFDSSETEWLIFDEFIPQRQERPIAQEGQAFLNCYETINRNRELQGKPPVRTMLLANSFDIAPDIFIELDMVSIAEKMMVDEVEICVDYERGFCIAIPRRSPISSAKEETALYKLAGKDSDYAQMAIYNKFKDNDFQNIRSVPLKELILYCTVGELCIYKHKSMGYYYATTHKSGKCKHNYTMSYVDVARFKKDMHILFMAHLKRRVTFQSYLSKSLFEKIFKM